MPLFFPEFGTSWGCWEPCPGFSSWGPAILSGLYEQWRISWLLGNFERLREIRGDWHGWIMLFGAYFVAVLTFASWFIMQGANRTSIYNVDPHQFESAAASALEESAIVWKRADSRTLVFDGACVEGHKAISSNLPPDSADKHGGQLTALTSTNRLVESPHLAKLEWQPFQTMHHVSLRWTNVDARVREAIEIRLAENLRFVRSPHNPAAGWFFTSGAILMLFSLLTLGALVALRLLRLGA